MAEAPIINNQFMAEISIIKPKLSSSYPIKRLTYSEMQQLCNQGLCLSCNSIDTVNHRCLVKKIVLVLPDEDPYAEQQPMESFYEPPPLPELRSATSASTPTGSPPPVPPTTTTAPTVPEQLNNQDILLHAVNNASNLRATRPSALFYDHQATSLIVDNGKMMENKGVSGKNYKCILTGLIKYETSPVLAMMIGFVLAMLRNCCLKLFMDPVQFNIKRLEGKSSYSIRVENNNKV